MGYSLVGMACYKKSALRLQALFFLLIVPANNERWP